MAERDELAETRAIEPPPFQPDPALYESPAASAWDRAWDEHLGTLIVCATAVVVAFMLCVTFWVNVERGQRLGHVERCMALPVPAQLQCVGRDR